MNKVTKTSNFITILMRNSNQKISRTKTGSFKKKIMHINILSQNSMINDNFIINRLNFLTKYIQTY